ncbi:MAG: hypothetical protein M5U34_45895 [Chloroflexi bacterium]|nr:hypothetical protein [Chloroflexota bacterium]
MNDELKRLQAEIEALDYAEFVQLREWFAEKDQKLWDAQIEADSNAGKLDFLIHEAMVKDDNEF